MIVTSGEVSAGYDLRDDFTGEVIEHFDTEDQANVVLDKWLRSGPGQDMTVYKHEDGVPESCYVNLPPYLR